MLKLREFIQRAKTFINENPKRAKFIGLLIIVIVLPLTVLAALTIQDLRQRAGGGPGLVIVDEKGNFLPTASDTQVYLRINLPVNWVFSDVETSRSGFIQQAYAQTICGDETCSPGQTCQTINEGGGVFSQICVGTSIPTSTPTPVPPTPTPVPPTSTLTPVVCSSLSYNGKPNVCSDNSGTCPKDYLKYGFKEESAGFGAIYGTSCTSSTTPSRTCCYYSPTTADAPTSTPIPTLTATPIPPTATPVPPTATPVPPTPTPIPNILQAIYIENKDSDGSYNGSKPLKITSGFESYINGQIPWKLNDLLPFQNQATRIVQVTLLGSRDVLYYTGTVSLVRPDYPVSGTVILPTAIPPVSSTVSPTCKIGVNTFGVSDQCTIGGYRSWNFECQDGYHEINTNQESPANCKSSVTWRAQAESACKNSSSCNRPPTRILYDLNADGVVNCKDTKILIGQYGKLGPIAGSSDLNLDGKVDGIDYNILFRNYTPGDTTVCN